MQPATPDHVVAAMQIDIDVGLSQGKVAKKHGVHRTTIERLVRRGKLTTKPEFHRPGNKPGIANFGTFPKWLPRDLRPDYHDNARLYGEEHAARLARAAKAEAMTVEA